MLTYPIKIEGLKGVGTVELNLQDNQRVYTLIGVNGVGKTKTLEALFQFLFLRYQQLMDKGAYFASQINWVFRDIQSGDVRFYTLNPLDKHYMNNFGMYGHHYPVVFIASQNRGFIHHSDNSNRQAIGTLRQRRDEHFNYLLRSMDDSFASIKMDMGVEDWFVTLAQSANPYQKPEDNREVEIKVLLDLLSRIDARIDPHFMVVSGDGRVSLKIDGQARELSQLSTGFASLVKILQAIISGYGYFTNETRLQHVKGIVLIDEIESHLHLAWQAKIIPLLKELFPNTTFYITTHSSVVLSPLKDGEAYRLERDPDGVVRTKEIKSPSKASLVDVLKDAFDIDVNRIKLENTLPSDQQVAKQQLLDLLG